MLHGDFQLQKVLPKINVARKLNVKKSCNEEHVQVQVPVAHMSITNSGSGLEALSF